MKHRGQVLFLIMGLFLLLTGSFHVSAAPQSQVTLQPECAVTAQIIGGQGFNLSGQGFNFSGQGFNFSGQGFNLSGQGFNLSGQGFNLSGQGFNLSGQGFNLSGQNYADPAVVSNEVLNNIADPNWVANLLSNLNISSGSGYGEAQSAVIVVDQGLHLLEVQEVLIQLAAATNMAGIRIETIDIAAPSINYRVANIASAIDSRVQLLRSQGVKNAVINMSLAFIPCSDPVTGFNFDAFIAKVNASNQQSSEIVNAPVVPIFECVLTGTDGKTYARFGYDSDNTRSVTVTSASGKNKFNPKPEYRNQPEIFEVGRHSGVVEIAMTGKQTSWVLTGPDGVTRTAVADKNGTRCSTPLPAATQPVEPILECVYSNGNGNFVARFGYKNSNVRTVYIPTNSLNKFTPNPGSRGQISHFLPGRHAFAFEVQFNGADIRWQVTGPDGVTREVLARPIATTCATDATVIDLGDYLALINVAPEDIPETVVRFLNDTTDTSPLRDLLRAYLIESANPDSPYNTVAVASSGNYRPWSAVLGVAYPGEPLAPARWSETISVSASLGQNPNQLWFFSHDGNVMARGAGYRLGTQFYVAGTSFSAPAVSLVLAHFGKFADACTYPTVNGIVYPPLRNPTQWGNASLEGGSLPLYCDVPQNTPPVAGDDGYMVDEDTPLTVAAPGLLENDSDAEEDTLTAQLVTSPSNGQINLAPDGGFTYTPNLNYNGIESFTYVASDGLSTSNIATIIIIVETVNDAPTISAESATTNEDTAVDIPVSVEDVDGDPVTVGYSDPAHGSLEQTALGVIYTPDLNFNGIDSFSITATDGSETTYKEVIITVLAVNDAPTAENITASVNAGQAVPVTLLGADVDGDGLTYTVLSTPLGGALSGEAPNLIYTANAVFWGLDSFTYQVTDVNGATSEVATVSITVNALPVANNQTVTTDEDVALGIVLSGSDAEGATLTYAVLSQPANGILSGVAPNLVYTPNANFFGGDAFTFSVSDGIVDSALATVNITVNAVNDAPIANALSIVTDEDIATSITLSGSDVEGAILSFSLLTSPTNGALSGVVPNLIYTPNADFFGGDSFTYVVNDGMVDSAVAIVSITVNPVNDAPSCELAQTTTPILWLTDHSMQPISIINLTDKDGEVVTVTVTAVMQDEPVNGTGDGDTSPDASGVGSSTVMVRAERAGNGNGRVYYISYQASDGQGGTCTGVVEVGISHDQGNGSVPIGEGAIYDSTQP